jgi:uncharacterized repeat protein (TIGR03806 family)
MAITRAADEVPLHTIPAPRAVDVAKAATAFECRWADGPISIDGAADEPAWRAAQVIDNFYLPWLGKNAHRAKTATKARVLWDREYFYFFAEMEDHDLFADITDHDGALWNNDVFELFFKPADDKPGYYEFEVNAANAVLDMFLPRRDGGGYNEYARADKFHIDTKVKLRGTLNKHDGKDSGWSVEGRIPWRDFRHTGGRPNLGETWKFALCRYDYTKGQPEPELSTCVPLQKMSFHAYEDYATLKFTGPGIPASKDMLEKPFPLSNWQPATTSRVVGSPEPPPPYHAVRTLPKLTPDYPIFVATVPGSRRLIFVDELWPYGPTSLACTSDNPEDGKRELLVTFDNMGVAYSAAFHPRFAENHFLYVGWNSSKKTRVTRYTLDRGPPFRIVPNSARTIIEWESDGHNGGAVAFGLDGLLFVTSGDGTSDSDGDIVGQRLDRLNSKVLRIDVDHPDAGREYSVPKDNPFIGQKIDQQGACPETWTYGMRNPWRITVDRKTGDVWVGQNGQDLFEQAYLIERGANYGWSVFEGSHPFYPNRKQGPTPISKPTFEHPHSEFRSLTGGVVYYGKRFPELQGCYLYGDYSTGKLWAGKVEGGRVVRHDELADTRLAITCISIDADGELLITSHRNKGQGGFFTLERNTTPTDPQAFPHTLSETGLFKDVAHQQMQPGAIPYSVNAPLWSDGAYKERFLILPPTVVLNDKPEPDRIDYTRSGGWGFPEHTVLVKSFALDSAAGDPPGRRWIETRLLVKEGAEWTGYSYAWNDAQTDATLVAKEGVEKKFAIQAADGQREQTWHYPSRTECMVCHSRAANFVLGLSEVQMNRDHDYGGRKANQLEVLERRGLLRVNWLEDMKVEIRRELSDEGLKGAQRDEKAEEMVAAKGQRQPMPSSLLSYPPEKLRRLVDPYDPHQDLALRARSYLHSNCAQCHVEAGGGNSQFDVSFLTDADRMKLIDVAPLHDTFGVPEAKLVASGSPEHSLLLHRIALRGRGQMPPLATTKVDEPAVKLLRDWIQQVKPVSP